MYGTRVVGAKNTLERRVWIEDAQGKIPLYADKDAGILNTVIEIPRWTNAKLEISKDESFNPIKQDVKKGALRFVKNCFPHHGYIWNYGAFPQTWEDPTHVHPDTQCAGDNDPLDICEIGEGVAYTGQVKQVKVLGTFALLDEGETDWKVIVVDVTDPLASKLNDIEDVEKYLPGLLRATEEWFRIYKIPDGKPENNFAFNGVAKNRAYAMKVIEECHEAWQRLIMGVVPSSTDVYNVKVYVQGSPYLVGKGDAVFDTVPKNAPVADAAIDASVDKWFYISAKQ